MKYYCEFCKYETTSSGNWIKHKKTKKHVANSQSQKEIIEKPVIMKEELPRKILKSDDGNYICEFCDKEFKYKNAYYRHKKHNCFEKKEDEKIKLKIENAVLKKESEMAVLKKEIEMNAKIMSLKDEIISITKTENEHNKKLTVNAGAMVGKSLSTIAFVSQNFKNADHIKPIDHDTFKRLMYEKQYGVKVHKNKKISDYEVCQILINFQNQNILIPTLGIMLGTFYRTIKQNDQCLWVTDCSRNTFLINSKLNKTIDSDSDSDDDNSSDSDDEYGWLIDKRGIKVTEIIINPLAQHIDKLMYGYKAVICEMLNNNRLTTQTYIEQADQAEKIQNSISSRKMQEQILKELAPQLYLQK